MLDLCCTDTLSLCCSQEPTLGRATCPILRQLLGETSGNAALYRPAELPLAEWAAGAGNAGWEVGTPQLHEGMAGDAGQATFPQKAAQGRRAAAL